MNELSILTGEQLNTLREEITKIINQPIVYVKFSDLGGIKERLMIITVSLDEKEKWSHGYIENSRYTRFHYDPNDKGLEQFAKSRIQKKFRKSRPNNCIEAANKIKKYIEENI